MINNSVHVLAIQETPCVNQIVIRNWATSHNFLFFGQAPHKHKHNPGKAGVAFIIAQKNISFSVISCKSIIPNRAQLLTVVHCNVVLTFLNIYCPSGSSSRPLKSRADCIGRLNDFLRTSNPDNLTLMGNFNFVLSKLDRSGPCEPNTLDKNSFLTLTQKFNLVDIYRLQFPERRMFSFVRSFSASRIVSDRFQLHIHRIYVQTSILPLITQNDYVPCTFSDHSQCPIITINSNKAQTKSKHKSYTLQFLKNLATEKSLKRMLQL